MRDLKRYFLGSVVCIVFSALLYGQDPVVKQICGSDTVKISLDNYQYGKVDWQESYDGINWLTIEDQHDTVLVYFTSEEKYIRGCITTTDCEQVFSDPAHIRQKPKAYAGMDKDVMTDFVMLKGNKPEGEEGVWKIIQGAGGQLDEPFETGTMLSGTDTAYTVTWTLSNEVCGSSTDTMTIRFIDNEYYPYRLLVGEEDLLLPDSSDIENGVYYVRFSSLIPDSILMNDTILLIGYSGDGFLRKIYDFDRINDSTFRFFTTQAQLEDLLIEGVMNFGDDINLEPGNTKSAKHEHVLEYLPGREEILSDPKYREGVYIYYYPDEFIASPFVKSVNASKGNGFDISLASSVKIDFTDELSMKIGLEGTLYFDPNFVFDYRVKCGFPHHWWKFECGLNSLKAGMENAEFGAGLKIQMDTDFEWSDTLNKKDKKYELYSKKMRKVIIAGTVPVLVVNNVSVNFTVVPKLKAQINASYSWDKTSFFSAYMLYEKGAYLKPVCEKTASSSSSAFEVVVKGTAGVDFKLEPKVDMKLYGTIGPYLKVPLSISPEICASYKPKIGDDDLYTWGFNVPVSMDAELGVEMKFFKKLLFDASVSTNIFKIGFYSPYRIDIVSGNHQLASPNMEMDMPFKVQVKNNLGWGSKLIPIYFSVEDGDGTFEDPISFTGIGGYAENYLTLGEESYNKVRAEAFFCDFSPLKGSDDAYFEVNSGCKNSSLQLSFTYLADRIVETRGVLGTAPYTYSLDNLDYQSDPIQLGIEAAIDQEYFYVRDAEGCIAANTVEAIDSCNYSDLSVTVRTIATSAIAEGASGTPPYAYSLDSDSVYSEIQEFPYLDLGDHEVFIKDQSGCTSSQVFTIQIETTDNLLAYYPFNGNALDASGNFHDGIVEGVSFVEDRFKNSGSAAYSEMEDVIRIPKDEELVFEGDFSISAWLFTGFSGEIISEYHSLLSIGPADGVNTLHFLIRDSDGAPYYRLMGHPEDIWINYRDEDADVDAWHFYTLVRKADTILLYRDAERIASHHHPGSIGNGMEFYFGNSAEGDFPLNTSFDDIRIYKRAILPSEIQRLYRDNGWKDGMLNDPFIDPRDGQSYGQLRIGDQVWMAENLRATAYRDGTEIPQVTDNLAWAQLEFTRSGAYCWYNNDSVKYAETYGPLYNAYSIENDNLCPVGWHVPDYEESRLLWDYLGGYEVAGGKLKESGFHHWQSPNTGATNISEFTALPGGMRSVYDGEFYGLGEVGQWWIKEFGGIMDEMALELYHDKGSLFWPPFNAARGASVRCLRDE